MTRINALEELRELKEEVYGPRWGIRFDCAIEKVESEIAERFMELPVDADGVPIRPGDRIELDGKGGEVRLVGALEVMCDAHICYTANMTKHAKLRSLEDVLATYRNDAQNIYEDPLLDGDQRVDELERLDSKFVDKIARKMIWEIDKESVKRVEGRLAELGYRKCSDCAWRREGKLGERGYADGGIVAREGQVEPWESR